MDGQYAGNAPFSLPIKTPENKRTRFIFFRCMGFGVSDRLRGLEGPGGESRCTGPFLDSPSTRWACPIRPTTYRANGSGPCACQVKGTESGLKPPKKRFPGLLTPIEASVLEPSYGRSVSGPGGSHTCVVSFNSNFIVSFTNDILPGQRKKSKIRRVFLTSFSFEQLFSSPRGGFGGGLGGGGEAGLYV